MTIGAALRAHLPGTICMACVALVVAVAAPAAVPMLRIGLIGRLAGPAYGAARDLIDGFRLGAKSVGGKLGGFPFQIVVIDDSGDPALAEAAYDSLSTGPGVHLVLLDSSPAASVALSEVSAVGQGMVLNLGDADPDLAAAGCTANFFSLTPPRAVIHRLAGQYFQDQGFARVVLIGVEGQESALPALRQAYQGEITEITVRRGEMDFTSALIAIRNAKPQAVYLTIEAGLAVNFLIQFQAAHLDRASSVYAPEETLDRQFLIAAGSAANGVYGIGPWSGDLDAPGNKKLVADFVAEYDRDASYQAALGFEAALLVDGALRRAEPGSLESLRDALRRAEVAGPLPDFHFDDDQFPAETYLLRQTTIDAHGALTDTTRATLAQNLHLVPPGVCAMEWNESPPPSHPGKPAAKRR